MPKHTTNNFAQRAVDILEHHAHVDDSPSKLLEELKQIDNEFYAFACMRAYQRDYWFL